MSGMKENNRMTSIARRINFDFWLKQFSNLLFIDVVLVILVIGTAVFWKEGGMPSDFSNVDKEYVLSILENLQKPAVILLVIEGIVLIGELFNAGKVRKMMRPLTEIALETEKLSKRPFGDEKIENIQQAISELNPDMPGAKVKTGDKDLLPLEIAINNLLERMRESHRQQERFVSDASHELRTPISVIQGYANLLDRWGKEDEQVLSEGIEAIKNESEHMKSLIEQLLFLARGDSGRNTLEFKDFDLTEMVRDVWEESSMIDQNHRYVFVGDKPVTLKGDAAMIKQSLRILVENAVKYSGEGDTIYLKALWSEGRPAYVVQDEGIGMSESEVVHVFERFYRSDGARNSAEGGTGLGLSIAKWIVDAHNGKVEVLSRPDLGTRFTVKF